MTQHLWEIKHSYYCNEGNYYASFKDCPGGHYKSWAEFHTEFKDVDKDYNLLFRWDWVEGEEHDLTPYNGDDYYRNGHLKIFWLHQRQGLYRWDIIEVCRADEPEVIKFLLPFWKHLRDLWEPISSQ